MNEFIKNVGKVFTEDTHEDEMVLFYNLNKKKNEYSKEQKLLVMPYLKSIDNYKSALLYFTSYVNNYKIENIDIKNTSYKKHKELIHKTMLKDSLNILNKLLNHKQKKVIILPSKIDLTNIEGIITIEIKDVIKVYCHKNDFEYLTNTVGLATDNEKRKWYYNEIMIRNVKRLIDIDMDKFMEHYLKAIGRDKSWYK